MRIPILSILLISVCALKAQSITLLTINELNKRLEHSNDTAFIVNFWATWCAPCVDELPNFEKLKRTLKNKPAKVLLVSVDFKSKLEPAVRSFVKRRKIRNEVFLLNETNQQEYIDRIDPGWSGTIPATLFVFRDIRKFKEQSFTYSELLREYETLK